MEWTGTIQGRVASKKNSRRFVQSGRSSFTVPSKAYGSFHDNALDQLLTQKPKHPIDTEFEIIIAFNLKGKMDSDIDNLATSILDVLADASVIANDKLCMSLAAGKTLGLSEFSTRIRIRTL